MMMRMIEFGELEKFATKRRFIAVWKFWALGLWGLELDWAWGESDLHQKS